VNEIELLKFIGKKKAKGQKKIYEQYSQTFFRIAIRYCSNKSDAEEVTLNAFLKIFDNIIDFEYKEEGSLNAWMKRILINEALMLIRKKKYFDDYIEIENIEIDSEVYPDSNLKAEDIFSLIRNLPTGYRVVFNMFVIEDYSHKEIADKLGISINTSKTQLCKARRSLQKIILLREEKYEF